MDRLIPILVIAAAIVFVGTLVLTCDPEPATVRAMRGAR